MVKIFGEEIELPLADNTAEALQIYRTVNKRFRQTPWPRPFDTTTHTVSLGDARDLSAIADGSVHLVVTSPPYWTLKEYPRARRASLAESRTTRRFCANSTESGRSASACSFQADVSAASLATYACRGASSAAIS
jgi:hypothetical protein